MSDVVESSLEADICESPIKPNKNARALEQEVKDCTEILKGEYTKFRQYKILLECIDECIEDINNLDPELRAKIKKIIFGEQVSQISLNDSLVSDSHEAVLGVPLGGTELTYSEGNKLQSCVRSKLENKFAKLESEPYLLFGNDVCASSIKKTESPLELAQDDVILVEYRNQLDNEQKSYVKKQIDLLEHLEELENIRLKTVPEVTMQKYQECSFKTCINYFKSQLANHKNRSDIFMESKKSLKAYTEIIKDMQQHKDELTLEIERLEFLKKKYRDVSCKEYDDILKSYLQYKSSLEKRKLMYSIYK